MEEKLGETKKLGFVIYVWRRRACRSRIVRIFLVFNQIKSKPQRERERERERALKHDFNI